ncbi:MAG TPA: alpha/beta hydrolase [Bacteroidales bacterium]|nr:alpha/beta hydrolase [Bacteroidales bacterium]
MHNYFPEIKRRSLYIVLLLSVLSCNKSDDFNALVPATADQNPDLLSVEINVAGHNRLVHYQTFGDPENPVLFILHGSASDMRAYLPLQILSDKYHVVFWDMRGNGLSERCTAEELAIKEMPNEIEAMKKIFSPEEPVSILGHSWSAFFVARYIAEYPNSVKQAILIEPNGLKDAFMEDVGMALNLFTEGYMDMMLTNKYLTAKDQEMLDYQAQAMLLSGVRNFYCDPENQPEWPIWRVGAYALIVWEKSLLQNGRFSFDYTEGLDVFPGEVLLVGTECSPIGYDFQAEYHQPLFQHAEVLRIENSGHRLLTENFDALIDGLKDFLVEYE